MLCKAARPSGWGWGAWWGRPAPAPAPGFTLAAAHWPCWLAMKGVNLQHRQVLGRGFSSLTGDAAVGRVGDRRAHLPWAAASAAPPASCGDCAPPLSPRPCPMGGMGLRVQSLSLLTPGLSTRPPQSCRHSGDATPGRAPSPAPGVGLCHTRVSLLASRELPDIWRVSHWEPLFHVLKIRASE